MKKKLVDVINKLCDIKNYNDNTRNKLHGGRFYLNYVKHNNNKFKNHTEGLAIFRDSFSCLGNNGLIIV